MTEVKSLNVTADTYRHRGWMWQDRATYDTFKAHMKLPLWIDRILTDSGGENLFVVGKEDGQRNTIRVGSFRAGVRRIPALFEAHRAQYGCRNVAGNGFRVLAERIRAKKPDANKTPRPQWRRTMTKPWEPGTLGGHWVVDSKFVSAISLNTPTPPVWADRLWVSTSAATDTFMWVNSAVKGLGHGGELHAAKYAVGIKGHQIAGSSELDAVVCNSVCHWQLAGVRKKSAWTPEPEVAKPVPDDKPITAAEIRAVQAKVFHGTNSSRVRHLNSLLAAPYGTNPSGPGHDTYAMLATQVGTTRADAKSLWPILFASDFAVLENRIAAQFASKPPLGVKPRNLHDEERANALDEAMTRHLAEDLPFPIEWATEWNELRARLNKEQK